MPDWPAQAASGYRMAGVAPRARVYHNAAQSITNNAVTALAFNSERFDNDGIHDTTTNTGRLTCKTAGVYAIGGHVNWANNATGLRLISIRLNGTTLLATQGANAVTTGNSQDQSVVTLGSLALNDYMELMVYQSSGGALNVQAAGNYSPEFWMVRVAEVA